LANARTNKVELILKDNKLPTIEDLCLVARTVTSYPISVTDTVGVAEKLRLNSCAQFLMKFNQGYDNDFESAQDFFARASELLMITCFERHQ